MTCSCPNCQAKVEVNISAMPEKGTFIPCPECKTRFWMAKEAYARMSLIKKGVVYCDQCGKELEHKIVCSACGVMFPDYYLVQSSKPPCRQIEKPDYFSFSFSLGSGKKIKAYDYTYSSTKKTTSFTPGFNIRKIAVVAAVLLIAASIGFYFHITKIEQQFTSNYMRALYVINTGNDLSLKTCAKISADWNSNGKGFVPKISADDESRLNKIKNVADRYMQKLNNPPKKYIANKEKLANLYNIYSKTYSLAIAPSGSLPGFNGAVAKSQNEFTSSVASLKENMPVALSKQLQIAKSKFRGMQNI